MSAVMPIMSIYQLPLGQYGYTGHVINLPQDVVSFAQSLPTLPQEVDVLVVRKDNEQCHRDFCVRRSVVQDALTYMLENNEYYHANHVHLNQEALQQLPEDGNLTDVRCLDLPDAEGGASTHTPVKQSEPSQVHMELTSLHRLFQMLHSKGRSERRCSSPFRTSRLGHHAASCGLPLQELQSMSSILRDILV